MRRTVLAGVSVLLVTVAGCTGTSSSTTSQAASSSAPVPADSGSGSVAASATAAVGASVTAAAADVQSVVAAAQAYFRAFSTDDFANLCTMVDPAMLKGADCVAEAKKGAAAMDQDTKDVYGSLVVPPSAVTMTSPTSASINLDLVQGMRGAAKDANAGQVMKLTSVNGKWLFSG